MVLIIREGRDRRLQMKKGVAKRLLGNARAIVAGVFIATAALAGAAVEAVPYASRIRPDVVEVSKSGTHFARSFSRWGWRANEFVDMSGDLDEPRNREAVSTWIEQVNPRLVIMNACCPAYVHSCHPGASQSQVERRERVKRQKTDGIYQFIHRIVDGQVGCGDHILMDLPMRCDVHGKSFVEVICKHPVCSQQSSIEREIQVGLRHANTLRMSSGECMANRCIATRTRVLTCSSKGSIGQCAKGTRSI